MPRPTSRCLPAFAGTCSCAPQPEKEARARHRPQLGLTPGALRRALPGVMSGHQPKTSVLQSSGSLACSWPARPCFWTHAYPFEPDGPDDPVLLPCGAVMLELAGG